MPKFETVDNELVLDPNDPFTIASGFSDTEYTDTNGIRTMHRHRGRFYQHNGQQYRRAAEERIAYCIWRFLADAFRPMNNEIVPFKPTKKHVAEISSALGAVVELSDALTAPVWIDNNGVLPRADELLAVGNGLLHLPTAELHPLTPNFFNMNATNVLFDRAAACQKWLSFLSEIFGEDVEAISALQDFMGYLLSSDTSQQKILFIVGPKRSGKSTIARVITELLGHDNVVGPTLKSLSDTFGAAPLINKTVAIFADARLGGHSDHSAIVGHLLSISGEDWQTIAEKFLPPWTGRLSTRVILISNEMPHMNDSSGALASRFLPLTLANSFYGKEDPKLTAKLLAELPGILNWALEGYQRLSTRGYFVTPTSSQETIEELENLASPVTAFVNESCFLGQGVQVAPTILYAAWKDWCDAHGNYSGSMQTFGRDLKAAFPRIHMTRVREGTSRHRYYEGIKLE